VGPFVDRGQTLNLWQVLLYHKDEGITLYLLLFPGTNMMNLYLYIWDQKGVHYCINLISSDVTVKFMHMIGHFTSSFLLSQQCHQEICIPRINVLLKMMRAMLSLLTIINFARDNAIFVRQNKEVTYFLKVQHFA
jgi:hypothetical protein